jgi:hypothetical protein
MKTRAKLSALAMAVMSASAFATTTLKADDQLGLDPKYPNTRYCHWTGSCPWSDTKNPLDCEPGYESIRSYSCPLKGYTNVCCERLASISQGEAGPAPQPKLTFFQSANSVIGSIKAGVPVSRVPHPFSQPVNTPIAPIARLRPPLGVPSTTAPFNPGLVLVPPPVPTPSSSGGIYTAYPSTTPSHSPPGIPPKAPSPTPSKSGGIYTAYPSATPPPRPTGLPNYQPTKSRILNEAPNHFRPNYIPRIYPITTRFRAQKAISRAAGNRKGAATHFVRRKR